MTSGAPKRAKPATGAAADTRRRARGPAPDPDQRAALLGAAANLLATEGPDALTVRRIAAEAGCSTMGVYSRFGGKDGIVEELFVDGFRRLHASMDEGKDLDPQAALTACGRGYRRFGLEHPTAYQVMFEKVVPGFVPSEAAQLEGMATFAALVAKIERAIAAGVLAAGDPMELAHRFWATAHGWVSLEIHEMGWLGDAQERAYTDAMTAMVAGMAGPNHRPTAPSRRRRAVTAT